MDRLPPIAIPDDLRRDLERMNPWWHGAPPPPAPLTRRHIVAQIQRRLASRIAPIIAVRGPRQVGKSTAQLHVIEDLLEGGTPPRNIFRVQFDDLDSVGRLGREPLLRLADWYERHVLEASANEVARAGGKVHLFLDEVQNLDGWHVQLKFLADHTAFQLVVTGSSALRIELGRDSLAGRLHTLEVGTLSLTEIACFRGFDLGPPLLPDNRLDRLGSRDAWLELRELGKEQSAPREPASRRSTSCCPSARRRSRWK
ncbi:MAG: AAA family ATPase [Planctomycetes bacterium]|nr:AAA family ATPase [Planctomycetota bacterium]